MNFPDKLKLVIWDLDETFWRGTLSEEGIEAIPENIQLVKKLADRGIVSSISSKNDDAAAIQALKHLKVDQFFVFCKINWSPKGAQVRLTLEQMGLRAENCIFIDDNHLNLKEVESYCEGIYTYYPWEILPNLLQLDCSKGNADLTHDRLAKYKVQEKRISEQVQNNLSNTEFLRTCQTCIEIKYNCEDYIERIFELIERTNQLNYTKKRLEIESEKSALINSLAHYQTHAGVVFCSDKFGSYGLVGFFLMKKGNDRVGRLEHLVFSCRVINMGVESFVFDKLGRPDLTVVGPVAYPVDEYLPVDWISETTINPERSKNNDTLLLGPCHLLQLSNYFRTENNFFQYVKNGSLVKFDCISFLVGKREKIIESQFFKSGLVWSIEEFDDFHENLRLSERIILSLEDLLGDRNYIFDNDCLFRYEGTIKAPYPTKKLTINERVGILISFLDHLVAHKKNSCQIYILDALITERTPDHLKDIRLVYSHVLHTKYSAMMTIIQMADYLALRGSQLHDGVHLDRLSYYRIYNDIQNDSPQAVEFDYSVFDDNKIIMTKIFNLRLTIIRKLGRDSYLYALIKSLIDFIKKIKFTK